MRVQKYRVYLMRKGQRHYDYMGHRAVSVSDDGREAWLDVDHTEVHTVVRSADVLVAQQSSRRGILRDLYLHEQ
jgi:hypothetical protein